MPTLTPSQYAALTSRNRRRTGGFKAQRSGRNFETVIITSARDVVSLIHIPNGSKCVAKGRFVPVQSPFDFAGTVCGSGRAICFDAKSLGEDRASFPMNDPEKVEPHQIAALRKQGEAGAIAGFLVECKRLGAFLWLNIRHVPFVPRNGLPWGDPAWVNLGQTERLVDFGKLVAAAV